MVTWIPFDLETFSRLIDKRAKRVRLGFYLCHRSHCRLSITGTLTVWSVCGRKREPGLSAPQPAACPTSPRKFSPLTGRQIGVTWGKLWAALSSLKTATSKRSACGVNLKNGWTCQYIMLQQSIYVNDNTVFFLTNHNTRVDNINTFPILHRVLLHLLRHTDFFDNHIIIPRRKWLHVKESDRDSSWLRWRHLEHHFRFWLAN